jgi:hypothetical protein
VDGQAGVGLPVDLVQEVPEVHGPALGGQVADDLAGGGVQRGEQVDGAVPDIIVAAPLGHPGDHRQHRGSPLQRLYLRLFIHCEDRGIGRRRQIQAHDVADPVDQQRVGAPTSGRSPPGGPGPAWTSAWRPLCRYAGMRIWHAAVCIMFGFYLASSSLAPDIANVMTSLFRLL